MTPSWLKHIHLRRITTANRFIPEVDGFRFLAILIVVGSHIYGQVPLPESHSLFSQLSRRAFREGKIGVCLFFTISGFILALPFARHFLQDGKAVKMGSYLRRRVTRLEPPYIVAMVLRTPLVVVVKHVAVAVAATHLFVSLLYLHNIVYKAASIINPPAWSLEIEVQFYLLAPLLAFIFKVRQTALRQFLIVVLIAAGMALSHSTATQGRFLYSILNFSQYFMAGFLLCDIYVSDNRPRLPNLVWDGFGIAVIVWLLFGPEQWYFFLLPFLTVLLYLAGLYGTLLRRFFAYPAISITGGMCYSLYLTHTAVLTGISGIARRLARTSLNPDAITVLVFLVAFAGIFLVGALFYILLERPCMDPAWPQKLARWIRGNKPAASS